MQHAATFPRNAPAPARRFERRKKRKNASRTHWEDNRLGAPRGDIVMGDRDLMGHEAFAGLRWDDKWTSGWSTMGAEGSMGGAPGSERCGYGEPGGAQAVTTRDRGRQLML